MKFSNIGKFEMREIVSEFDATLIRLYGFNMLDADITRTQALNAFNEFHCPRKAAEVVGSRRGLRLEVALQPS